jgi:hypothetical protein
MPAVTRNLDCMSDPDESTELVEQLILDYRHRLRVGQALLNADALGLPEREKTMILIVPRDYLSDEQQDEFDQALPPFLTEGLDSEAPQRGQILRLE